MDNSNNENSDISHGMTPQTFAAEAVVPIGDVSTSPLNKRKSVDWVAAGHKAWATRRRNAALRSESAGTAARVTNTIPPTTTPTASLSPLRPTVLAEYANKQEHS